MKPKKCFRGLNGIRNHGLCVSAAVLHQLSYEDPDVGRKPIYWVHRTRGFPINWPQLVEHCSAHAEATGSNPVEAPKTFFGLNLRLLKSQLQLRWSHLHFISTIKINIYSMFLKKRPFNQLSGVRLCMRQHTRKASQCTKAIDLTPIM